MQRVIRTFAIIDVIAMGAFLVALFALGGSMASGWLLVWNLVLGAQLWVLFVIPLGVLAGSDAARRGRRRWLVTFTALTVLAVVAPAVRDLAFNIYGLLAPLGAPNLFGSGPLGDFIDLGGWTLALLPIPLAATAYTFTAAQGAAPDPSRVSKATRRLILWGALIGGVVVGALTYLEYSHFLFPIAQPINDTTIWYLGFATSLINTIWRMLVDTVPVAIASLAIADAARAARRIWVASLIALAVLGVLVANLITVVFEALFVLRPALPGGTLPFGDVLTQAQVAAPLVVLLMTLVYLFITRPRRIPPGLDVTE